MDIVSPDFKLSPWLLLSTRQLSSRGQLAGKQRLRKPAERLAGGQVEEVKVAWD